MPPPVLGFIASIELRVIMSRDRFAVALLVAFMVIGFGVVPSQALVYCQHRIVLLEFQGTSYGNCPCQECVFTGLGDYGYHSYYLGCATDSYPCPVECTSIDGPASIHNYDCTDLCHMTCWVDSGTLTCNECRP
jgi:hypothetical protein